MSAQRLKTRTEPQPNRTETPTRTPATERLDPRTAVESSPRTFSQDTAQLQNLIDEFNAAFADEPSDSAHGS